MIAREAGIAVSTTGFILSGKARKMKISEKTEQRVLALAKDHDLDVKTLEAAHEAL